MPVARALDEPGGDQHLHLPRDARARAGGAPSRGPRRSPVGRRRAPRCGAGWCRRAPGGPPAAQGPRRQCRWRAHAASGTLRADARPRPTDRRPPPARPGTGPGRRPRRRDRRGRDPGVHRQPDVVATPSDAPGRPAGLPRAPRRRRHPAARRPCPVPRQPRRAGARAPCAIRVGAGERAARGRGVGRDVRQRPRRLAPGSRRRGRHRQPHRGAPGRPGRGGGRCRGCHRRARERVRRRVGDGHRRSRSSPASTRRWSPRASGTSGSPSASMPRTCGAPATRSTTRRGSMPWWTSSTLGSASGGSRWSTSTTRARSSGRARTATSTSARGGSAPEGSAGSSRTRASTPPPFILETPGDGRGLRPRQHGPGARPRGGPATADAAAGRLRDEEREGPERAARDRRRRAHGPCGS